MSNQSNPLNERVDAMPVDPREAERCISDALAENKRFFEEVRDRQRVDPNSLHERITL